MIGRDGGGAPSVQRPLRADARRNRDRLLAAARDAFAAHGASASLDDIARAAGVGNATLYRHFPSREALLDAVFRDRVQVLCDQAEALRSLPSAEDALATWLRALIAHVTTYRGVATWLMSASAGQEGREDLPDSCQKAIRAAGASLLSRAQESRVVRPDVTAPQLLRLAHAIALATEETPGESGKLLALVMDGLRSGVPGTPQP